MPSDWETSIKAWNELPSMKRLDKAKDLVDEIERLLESMPDQPPLEQMYMRSPLTNLREAILDAQAELLGYIRKQQPRCPCGRQFPDCDYPDCR